MSTTKKKPDIDDDPLVKSLRLVDPLLQFLTKKTQKTLVPFSLLKMVLPGGVQLERHQCLLNHIPELARSGILQLNNAGPNGPLSWNDTKSEIGFPSPPDQEDIDYSKSRQNLVQTGSLSGSTKTAAKRRLAALKKALKAESKRSPDLSKGSLPASNVDNQTEEESTNGQPRISSKSPRPEKDWDAEPEGPAAVFEEELSSEEKEAFNALQNIFKFKDAPSSLIGLEKEEFSKNAIPQYVLQKQAAYAGSNPVQQSSFGELDEDVKSKIPVALLEAFGLGSPGKLARRRLYSHQATAINSAIRGCHTMVCTSTGSGKSLCFLLPALAAAYNASKAAAGIKATESFRGISLIMYPTKALAQDQLSKLKAVLKENEELSQHIVPATLDGDCSHEQRAYAAKHANILLTNPDTLHSAILPNWEKLYKRILTLLAYVVIDEAHVYEGVFGAHVALVLSRLHRLCVAAGAEVAEGGKLLPTFLASSATLAYPEHHLRLLCPISKHGKVVVLTPTDDGSPRSSKHFFVWNPPLLSMDGTSTASVEPQSKSKASGTKATQNNVANKRRRNTSESVANSLKNDSSDDSSGSRALVLEDENNSSSQIVNGFQRRHAADETALLLARAITNNVRCIAFCKTRMVVEWVYERTVSALKSHKSTEHLADKVQPYRGGYKLSDRREIEGKLFKKELIGVVATSALELGVDIGGIDLTLHTGYPMSIASLTQQAGRGGRGKRLDSPSLSIVICFGSPSEQHLWKQPRYLLSRGITSPMSFPINTGVIQSHLLCASKEFPLTGRQPVSALRTSNRNSPMREDDSEILPDQELFGSNELFEEAVNTLYGNGSLVRLSVPVASGGKVIVMKAHPSVNKPSTRVSIRSIEPINYSIVDLSHPNGVEDDKAVLDNLPYSRVFYHAFPGAIILHRGRKYRIESMTRPPPFNPNYAWTRNTNLAAYARPTREKYYTRPLSTNTITIVKQLERVDVDGYEKIDPSDTKTPVKDEPFNNDKESPASVALGTQSDLQDGFGGSFAGCGIVTSKRTVHGYKKLSLITRAEISRHELSLPPMEYDTFGLWIDSEAEVLGAFLGEDFGSGVHALSHALLAVAPLFIPCVRGDLECDHSVYSPTRVCLFDERAGGSGTCAELWKSLFMPNGLLEAAIKLLKDCLVCSQCVDDSYDGGCPACLQSGQCVKFNQFLSRSAALVIGKRMLKRLQLTSLYQRNASWSNANKLDLRENIERTIEDSDNNTPRKKARTHALRNAMVKSTGERLFVVGRPTWPTDEENMPGKQEKAD